MWGTLQANIHAVGADRFIPTHVGNTPEPQPIRGHTTVHPHACGEHRAMPSMASSSRGSSPRMWGTLPLAGFGIRCTRFIPTHVGNTLRWRRRCLMPAVHPHACGEHRPSKSMGRGRYGSSPRMWGTHLTKDNEPIATRFIPTHVGNTHCACREACAYPVHPHACGEHYNTVLLADAANGSSPRMWGTPCGVDPGRVGEPHACGEHSNSRRRCSASAGSSPRMWGTRAFHPRTSSFARFIPTHVGNTGGRGCGWTLQPVHPHACGEH